MAYTVLIRTIIAMIFVSLHPFAFRKIVLFSTAILGLSSVVCFADSLFMARRFAPEEHGVDSSGSQWSWQDKARPARPSAPPADANDEKSPIELQQRFLEMEDFVITPIVNQPGQLPACVRRTQAVYVVRTI